MKLKFLVVVLAIPDALAVRISVKLRKTPSQKSFVVPQCGKKILGTGSFFCLRGSTQLSRVLGTLFALITPVACDSSVSG